MKVTRDKASILGLATTTLLCVCGFTGCVYGPPPDDFQSYEQLETTTDETIGHVTDSADHDEVNAETVADTAVSTISEDSTDPLAVSSDEASEYDEYYEKGRELSEELKENLDSIDWDAANEKARETGKDAAEFLNNLFE